MIVPHTLDRLHSMTGHEGFRVGMFHQERQKWLWLARIRRSEGNVSGAADAVSAARQAHRDLLRNLKP